MTSAQNFGIIQFIGVKIKMQTNSPLAVPDEKYKLSPESLEIINVYLSSMDINDTAQELSLPREEVVKYLNKTEVKKFINTVFLDQGYNNQFKLQGIMDDIIANKLEEAEETEIYSSKDLLDVITLQHKMRMDYLTQMIKLRELENKSPENQTNIQVNAYGDNFSALLDKLVTNG